MLSIINSVCAIKPSSLSAFTYTATGSYTVDSSSYPPYTVIKFTGNGTIKFTGATKSVNYLLVGGGGGGGVNAAGGGGAGGLLNGSFNYTAGTTYLVNVGLGGTGSGVIVYNSAGNQNTQALNGGNSTISGGAISLISYGGGGGGNRDWCNEDSTPPNGPWYGSNGGSGGGGPGGQSVIDCSSINCEAAGNGQSGQGNNGGQGIQADYNYTTTTSYYPGQSIIINDPSADSAGGGGGGFGGTGQNASDAKGGDGGRGFEWAYTGSTQYAGGGGGSAVPVTDQNDNMAMAGTGSYGGGDGNINGNGGNATTYGSGGGAGGIKYEGTLSSYRYGGNGYSGICIFAWTT